MPTTIFQPTIPTTQSWPKVKISNSVFFVQFGWNLARPKGGLKWSKNKIVGLKYQRPFFDLPARPNRIDQKWKFLTSVVFVQFGSNLAYGLIMGKKQHRMSLICLRATTIFRPTSYQPKSTKNENLTFMFFVRFGWNLVWGLIMGQKQHSLKCLRPFFDQPARPTKIDHL